MVRETQRLTALGVARLKKPGMYPDGAGLYLQISKVGSKSWVYRFMLHGRAREMGLGAFATVGLADARQKATDAAKLVKGGIDPIEARKAQKAEAALEAAKAISFKSAAEKYIAAHEAGWKNEKHKAQWSATLETYAYPVFGSLPVQAVDTGLVTKVLEPIWKTKTETAVRLRGRIESVLDWAKARGYRTGENPARWRGHLENLLARPSKVQKTKHHPALSYEEVGNFVVDLREKEGTGALALEFTILTCARTSETIGATWKEIDLKKALWIVPADRIKAGKEHRVPLTPRAIAILKQMGPGKPDEYVFPGQKDGRPLSNMAMLKTLERMDREDLTVHGFRSTFRDWAAEQTNYPREVAEMALAHAVGDKVEAAYRRGDMFEKRRQMAEDWAKFCNAPLKGRKKVMSPRS